MTKDAVLVMRVPTDLKENFFAHAGKGKASALLCELMQDEVEKAKSRPAEKGERHGKAN